MFQIKCLVRGISCAGPFHSHFVLLFAANIEMDIGKNARKCIRWENLAKTERTDGFCKRQSPPIDRPNFWGDWSGAPVDITRQWSHRDPWKDFSVFVSTRDFSPFFSSFPLRKPNNMQPNNKKKTKAESECLARPIASHECVGVLFTLLFFGLCFFVLIVCR